MKVIDIQPPAIAGRLKVLQPFKRGKICNIIC